MSILCIVLYASYSILYILCIVFYALYPLQCVLCIFFLTLKLVDRGPTKRFWRKNYLPPVSVTSSYPAASLERHYVYRHLIEGLEKKKNKHQLVKTSFHCSTRIPLGPIWYRITSGEGFLSAQLLQRWLRTWLTEQVSSMMKKSRSPLDKFCVFWSC